MKKEKKPLDFIPQKSVEWYNPLQLAKTGVKALISIIFGNFYDKREIQVTFYQDVKKKHFDDFKNEKELWIDYISDMGEGFNPTFTMAKLLAAPELQVDGLTLPRGRLLVMGGDQVYPTASRDEYQNRLQGPYKAAFPKVEGENNCPHLFAIPGNHDWYDGLTNFLKIFCQERNIGNWQTKQHRSYFAIQLPYDVWLFGIDVQLNSDIDKGQLDYFEKIMTHEMKEGSKVILCTAEPSWVLYAAGNKKSYHNLRYFENKVANFSTTEKKRKNLQQILTLAGDLHHYARYEAKDGSQKITAGGGGAFMHPTQNLPEEIGGLREGPIELKKTYPSAKASNQLLIRNLWFGFTNWQFSLMTGIIYTFVGWLLYIEFSLHLIEKKGLHLADVFEKILFSPETIIWLLLIISSLNGFSKIHNAIPKTKYAYLYTLMGWIHGFVQAFFVVLSFWIVANINPISGFEAPIYALIVACFGFFTCGFLMSGFIFGCYLILTNQFLGSHDNEAYSSIKWTGYKNFIRLHLTEKELTIYPIGVEKVPQWSCHHQDEKPSFVAHSKTKYQFIEAPIVIKL